MVGPNQNLLAPYKQMRMPSVCVCLSVPNKRHRSNENPKWTQKNCCIPIDQMAFSVIRLKSWSTARQDQGGKRQRYALLNLNGFFFSDWHFSNVFSCLTHLDAYHHGVGKNYRNVEQMCACLSTQSGWQRQKSKNSKLLPKKWKGEAI